MAVVTGGSAGIGLATAEHLSRKGWAVAILARDQARLDQASSLLQRWKGKVLALSVDVADAKAVDQATDRIERELGPIAAWVNNAMSTVVAPADRISASEYARVTATTYLSQVHGTLAALRHMKPRGRAAFYAAARNIYLDEPHGDGGFWHRLEQLGPESMFIWGEEDTLVPIRFEKHVKRVLPGARHLELPCGHVPQVEAPRETHRAVRKFLLER